MTLAFLTGAATGSSSALRFLEAFGFSSTAGASAFGFAAAFLAVNRQYVWRARL